VVQGQVRLYRHLTPVYSLVLTQLYNDCFRHLAHFGGAGFNRAALPRHFPLVLGHVPHLGASSL
jgi:hypothetical protein